MPSPANNTLPIPETIPEQPLQPRRRGGRGLASLLLLAAWLTGLGLIALNWQNIEDWWRLRDYRAPAAIAELAEQDTMTPYGRKVFYVNKPEIEGKQEFAKSCPRNGREQTIVLGCYHAGQSGIFLLRVDDPRLNGVVQVTAAHEMLHGAYERLSDTERKRVDKMLTDYYNTQLKDQRILKTIEGYKKSEPQDVVNEMHSIFGTEIAQLPENLEAYYSQYFTNRAQIAAYANQYQSEFTNREKLVAQYDAQLSYLKNQIDNKEGDLQVKQAEISQRQSELTAKKSSGDTAGYNAGVPGYNSLISEYNAEVQAVRDLIAEYNQLVEKRNAVALEEDQLVESLNSGAAPGQLD